MIRILFTLMILGGSLSLRAQDKFLKQQNDNAWQIRDNKPEEAIAISEDVISKAQQSKDLAEEARAWSTKGHVFGTAGDFTSCYFSYDQAMKIRMSLADSSGVAGIYNNISNFKCNEGKLDDAIGKLDIAIRMYRRLLHDRQGNDSIQKLNLYRLGVTYQTLSKIYGENNDVDESVHNARLGMQIIANFPDKPDAFAHSCYTMANSYYNLYQKNSSSSDADSAVLYYNKAMSYYRDKEQAADWLAKLYHNYGVIELDQKHFTESWGFFEKGSVLYNEYEDFAGVFSILVHKGLWYSMQNRLIEGLSMLEQAKDLRAEGVSRSDSLFFFTLLAELYEKSNQKNSALSALKIAYALRDSLLSEDKNKQIQKFNAKEKEIENANEKMKTAIEKAKAEKNKQEALWFRTLALALLILCFLIFIILRQRIKFNFLKGSLTGKAAAFDELAQKLHGEIQVSMNDAIANISNLKKQYPDIEIVHKKIIFVNDQIRNISHNIGSTILKHAGIGPTLEEFCERISDGDSSIKASFQPINMTIKLPLSLEMVIYRLANLLTDNTLKHAKADSIVMHLRQTPDGVLFIYTDNGIGFDYDKALQNRSSSGIKEVYDLAQSMRTKPVKITPDTGDVQFSFLFLQKTITSINTLKNEQN